MWNKILVWLGFRSKCCGATTHYTYGWDWHEDGYECDKCGKIDHG